nr:hypothetical protein [Tanacetum cinerariifolium]
MCEKEVPLNNNIRKQIGDFVDMPNEVVEQRMDANVPDEIDGGKGEQVPNHVVKKGKLEYFVCKEVTHPSVNDKKGSKHYKRWYWNDPELENEWEELVVLQVEFADMKG